MSMSPSNSDQDSGTRSVLGIRDTIASVLAAFFGVQSATNRERDFTRGSPSRFFLVALGLTAVFVLLLSLIVQFILQVAQA